MDDETTIDGEPATAVQDTDVVPRSHFEDQKRRAEKAEAELKASRESGAQPVKPNTSNSNANHDDVELIADQFGIDPALLGGILQVAKKQVAKEYGLDEVKQDRAYNAAQKAFEAVVAHKEDYADIADKNAVIDYVLATGKSVEEALETMYGTAVKKTKELAAPLESSRTGGARVTGKQSDPSKMNDEELTKYLNSIS